MNQIPRGRRFLLLVGGLAALLAIAVPVIAADPSPPRGGAEGRPDNPGRGNAPEKGPELEKTLSGTVEESTDDQGRPTFTLTEDGVRWELSAGPKWFWGDENPLAAYVGERVEVAGTHHEGETDLGVETVNGKALREAGKPSWAGGPKAVGEGHPGWKAWKDGDGEHPGAARGRENAPGQLKDKAGEDPAE